nr:MAG TPA: hypothetical protein [Caudoviricetes sp.]
MCYHQIWAYIKYVFSVFNLANFSITVECCLHRVNYILQSKSFISHLFIYR